MRTTACLILLTLACSSALAQPADARRRIHPTQEGFLEVDPRTGAITECKRAQDGYRCHRVTEGDALLREEPGPQAQVPPLPPRQPPRTAPRPLSPTDEELERALDILERFLRRFIGIVRERRGEPT